MHEQLSAYFAAVSAWTRYSAFFYPGFFAGCLVLLGASKICWGSEDSRHGKLLVARRVITVLAWVALVGVFAVGEWHCLGLKEEAMTQDAKVEAAFSHDIKARYKVADVGDTHSDFDPWRQLDNWQDRPSVTVLLESGESATYDVGFDKDDNLTLYLPPNTSQPSPETIQRASEK